MKLRLLISAIFILPLLSGCMKDREDNAGEPHAISFSNSIEAETKAAPLKPNDPTILIHEGSSVGVFGTRVVNEASEQLFYNRELICDAVLDPLTPENPLSSVWNYSPLEYWKDGGQYFFTAVFPYSEDNAKIINVNYLNMTFQASESKDLMVARAYRDARGSYSKDPVNLQFKHATAAVRFLFGKASTSPSDNYALSSFKLENLSAAGTLNVISMITDANQNKIELSNWTPGAIGDLFSWTASSSLTRKVVPHPSDSDDPEDYLQMGWYYMVPQEISSDATLLFSISYNGGDPVEIPINIFDRDGTPGADSWEPNCVYNYYITLTEGGLDLTVKTVLWDEVTVTTDDVIFEG